MVWLKLKHATIVPLLGTASVESPFPALVSQWMSSGTLYMYLEQGTITASTKVELATGIANGLKYLHSENVVHGDLHPANVLIDGSGNARLTDFGLSTVVGDAELQLSTTTADRTLNPRWRAPEVIGIHGDPERPTFKSDAYSFGGVMFFIVSGDMPWKEKNSLQISIALSNKTMPARPDNILDYHWDLIQRCWSWDAGDRPGAVEVVGCVARGTEQLQPTCGDILQIGPRFRLLVIGNAEAGKSSLIKHAFKINEVEVSEYGRHKVDVNRELIAPENGQFVLHDSDGFEAGDSSRFEVVKEFLDRRRKMPELTDKIHAVWLCISIPHSDRRLLDRASREFLESRREILDNIPIIAVFTKYDVLVDALELKATDSEYYNKATLERLTKDHLNRLCVQPLKDVAGSDILHATVSTMNGYESTLRQLIDLTTTNVEKFVASEGALAMMIHQRVDIGLKVKASISVGKKRCQRVPTSSMNFAGSTMWHCISVIHKDIIDVWNFNDPHCHLASDELKAIILKDLDKDDFSNVARALELGPSVVSAIRAILTPLAAPFLQVVVPTATGVVVDKWVYDLYQPTNLVLGRFMMYIVDLTCIMQILFLLVPTGPISRRVIKTAIGAYEETGKGDVHSAIQSYVPPTRSGRDNALEVIVGLMERHSIKAEEVQDLRMKIGQPTGLQLDEGW
ncbi:kinase-like domain-containing protein [Suillus ampliporus]|nr:kinase-like domain-containing protein [Suillus ampliporus]